VALYGDVSPLPPTGPLLVWAPASGRIRRFVAAGCGRVDELTLAAKHVVFGCETSVVDFADSAVRVFGPASRRPVQLFYGVDSFYADPKGGDLLGGLAGDAGTTVFTTERTIGHGLNPRLAEKRLWRVDGLRRSAIASGRTLGDPVAVDRGRILLQGGVPWAEIVDARGRVVVRLPVPGPRRNLLDLMTPRLALAGNRVAFLDKRRLRVYDAGSGRLLTARRVPPGRKQLAGASSGLIAYVHGRTVHVVRLGDGRETILRVAAARPTPGQRELQNQVELVHADLSAAGLFYSYNVPSEDGPGRVVFVPRARLRL
jgi:hypothetical protein